VAAKLAFRANDEAECERDYDSNGELELAT